MAFFFVFLLLFGLAPARKTNQSSEAQVPLITVGAGGAKGVRGGR